MGLEGAGGSLESVIFFLKRKSRLFQIGFTKVQQRLGSNALELQQVERTAKEVIEQLRRLTNPGTVYLREMSEIAKTFEILGDDLHTELKIINEFFQQAPPNHPWAKLLHDGEQLRRYLRHHENVLHILVTHNWDVDLVNELKNALDEIPEDLINMADAKDLLTIFSGMYGELPPLQPSYFQLLADHHETVQFLHLQSEVLRSKVVFNPFDQAEVEMLRDVVAVHHFIAPFAQHLKNKKSIDMLLKEVNRALEQYDASDYARIQNQLKWVSSHIEEVKVHFCREQRLVSLAGQPEVSLDDPAPISTTNINGKDQSSRRIVTFRQGVVPAIGRVILTHDIGDLKKRIAQDLNQEAQAIIILHRNQSRELTSLEGVTKVDWTTAKKYKISVHGLGILHINNIAEIKSIITNAIKKPSASALSLYYLEPRHRIEIVYDYQIARLTANITIMWDHASQIAANEEVAKTTDDDSMILVFAQRREEQQATGWYSFMAKSAEELKRKLISHFRQLSPSAPPTQTDQGVLLSYLDSDGDEIEADARDRGIMEQLRYFIVRFEAYQQE